MATKKSLEKAAQAWCKKDTEHLTMIPELAKEFAKILDRENIFRSMKRDHGLYIAWHANIAMAFKDEFSRWRKHNQHGYASAEVVHKIANTAASNFLNLLLKK